MKVNDGVKSNGCFHGVSPEPLPLGLAREYLLNFEDLSLLEVKATNVSLWITTPLGDGVEKCFWIFLSLTVGPVMRRRKRSPPLLTPGVGASATTANV